MKHRNKCAHAIRRIKRSKQQRLLLSQQRRLYCIYHGIQKMAPPILLIYLHAYLIILPTEVTTVCRYGRSSTTYAVCPGCGTAMEREYQQHCDSCGQALLWNCFCKGNIKHKTAVFCRTANKQNCESTRDIFLHTKDFSKHNHNSRLNCYT